MIEKLIKKKLIKPGDYQAWFPESIQYEVMMGSEAYGVSSNNSDVDIYGFCIPPATVMFPHLRGEVFGFDNYSVGFEQLQLHHIKDPNSGKEYDCSIYSINKYFKLITENNPNFLDSLFVPNRCLFKVSPIAQMVLDNRKMFLHKGCWHKFKGYAYKSMSKIRQGDNFKFFQKCDDLGIDKNTTLEDIEDEMSERVNIGFDKQFKLRISNDDLNELHSLANAAKLDGNRADLLRTHGVDTKKMYHVVRLLSEVEQILIEHDLDLERNREQLKSIRRGEWSLEQVEKYFETKEKELERIYQDSKLPYGPDLTQIRILLVKCLESWHTDLKVVDNEVYRYQEALYNIKRELEKVI